MDLFGVNDYKMSDLVGYVGLFGGIILTYKALSTTIETSFVRLLIGLVVGIGLGWLLRVVYASLNTKRAPGEE